MHWRASSAYLVYRGDGLDRRRGYPSKLHRRDGTVGEESDSRYRWTRVPGAERQVVFVAHRPPPPFDLAQNRLLFQYHQHGSACRGHSFRVYGRYAHRAATTGRLRLKPVNGFKRNTCRRSIGFLTLRVLGASGELPRAPTTYGAATM